MLFYGRGTHRIKFMFIGNCSQMKIVSVRFLEFLSFVERNGWKRRIAFRHTSTADKADPILDDPSLLLIYSKEYATSSGIACMKYCGCLHSPSSIGRHVDMGIKS
jgi:hypothetical protein